MRVAATITVRADISSAPTPRSSPDIHYGTERRARPRVLARELAYLFFVSSAMPHFGHFPGLSDFTSGCIGQL